MKEFNEKIHPENDQETVTASVSKTTDEIKSAKEGTEYNDPDQNRQESVGEDTQAIKKLEERTFEQKEEAEQNSEAREENVQKDSIHLNGQKKEAEENLDLTTMEETEAPRYSSSYAPPYYVPNFSVHHVSTSEIKSPSPKKSGGKTALHILLVAVALLLAATIGCVAGAWSAGFFYKNVHGTSAEIGDKPLTIQKNNGEVLIEENSENKMAKTYAEVVEMVASSVVEITVVESTGGISASVDAGSGVLIDQNESNGYLVTNYHVASASSQSIGVRLNDGSKYEATYLAGDEASDLAILSIAKKGNESFTVANFGSSEKLAIGDRVVAIGNPLGTLGGTVTQGIISGKNIDLLVNGFVMTLLQTDAAVNPGNSGGGLFNMAGELIGIVNAKVSAEGIEGLAFAIPGDYTCRVVEEAIEKGYVTGRPTLGIGVVYGTVGSNLSTKTGIAVQTSTTETFKEGDLITEINGVVMSTEADYCKVMKDLALGDTVNVKFSRLVIDGYSYWGAVYSWSDMEATVTVTEYCP